MEEWRSLVRELELEFLAIRRVGDIKKCCQCENVANTNAQ